ncbi:MAG: RDD family protein [Clostridia bacterium]|nr:RDD family protein [Clostridia bacterium]
MINLQKASFGKRIIAAIFDGILISIIAVGLIALFSGVFKSDSYLNKVNAAYAKYESQYGIEFQITSQQYEELSEQEKADWDTAYEALLDDEDAIYAYNMYINLTLLITTFSILISVIIIDFVVPLFFGNGQSLGKKIFGIALMHKEGIRVSNIQLFARAVLGKFALELMIPIYIIMMIFFNSIGVISIVILFVLLVIEIICLIISHTNSLLHDVLAGTVAVDMASQRIFESREALIEYTKKLHAEQANKSTY